MTWHARSGALLCAQVVAVLGYVVLLLLPVEIVSDGVRDGVIGDGALAVSAVIVVLRGVRWSADRSWSWPIAAGLGVYALGDILYDSWVSGLDPMPSPSAADFCYLVMYPLTALGLLLGVRPANRKVGRGLLLDGLPGRRRGTGLLLRSSASRRVHLAETADADALDGLDRLIAL